MNELVEVSQEALVLSSKAARATPHSRSTRDTVLQAVNTAFLLAAYMSSWSVVLLLAASHSRGTTGVKE